MRADEFYKHASKQSLKGLTRKLMDSVGLELTAEERQLLDRAVDTAPTAWAQVLGAIYSAKASQKSTEASDKQSRRMLWLTVALAFFAAVEAFATAVGSGVINF